MPKRKKVTVQIELQARLMRPQIFLHRANAEGIELIFWNKRIKSAQ
jgi:hypothetical protein